MHQRAEGKSLRRSLHDHLQAEEVVLLFHELHGRRPGVILEGRGESPVHE
jgi:hypothetical protein